MRGAISFVWRSASMRPPAQAVSPCLVSMKACGFVGGVRLT